MKMTREQYLEQYAKQLKDRVFKQADIKLDLSKVKISCGFPSRGATKLNNKTIGQCFPTQRSGAKMNEIFIHPELDDALRVGDVLAHELIHAHLDCNYGHKKPFRDIAVAIGLTGKMTATICGDELKPKLESMVKKLGKYPHKKLDATPIKKQTTRMLKAVCYDDDYIVRMSKKVAEMGLPYCGVCNELMELESEVK